MDYEGEREIRVVLSSFLGENRHGGIKKLVEASGLSRPTVSRIASGEVVSEESLEAIKRALTDLGYQVPLGSAATNLPPQDPMKLIADELSSLVNILRSNSLPEEYKSRRLASWLKDAHQDLLKSLEH